MLKFDISYAKDYISTDDILNRKEAIKAAHNALHNKTGAGSDFTGWVDLPVNYDRDEFNRIKKCADKIRSDSDILIVVGIGGSYLGARAAIEMLTGSFYNLQNIKERKSPLVLFAGNSISSSYLQELLTFIEGYDISINVISKSGTTTEPAVAFRLLKDYVEKKYGKEEAANRIYATTDKARGALRTLANKEGYETFIISDDIGGRYSVLTAVGLLPIAVAGIDINRMMEGALDAYHAYLNPEVEKNTCYRYAAARNALYEKGKLIEIMVNYEPSFHYFTEWWKQLYGESEGKDQKGIFPAGVDFSTDLHSMGQYIQDGLRVIFETVLLTSTPKHSVYIGHDKEDADGLNYIAGRDINEVNRTAAMGTILAHTDGGAPNLVIAIEEADAYNFGYLVYFFEKACGISGYLLKVNPFDQPGVEAYKKNMFALLDKPGYEALGKKLKERL